MTWTDDIGLLVVGAVFGAIVISLVINPAYNTLKQLCDQKYGANNWIASVEGNYWVCDAKKEIDVQCRIDGIGLERCNKKDFYAHVETEAESPYKYCKTCQAEEAIRRARENKR